MIKAMALVLALAGSVAAMDCGLHYSYASVEYQECREGNQREVNRQSEAGQARLDRELARQEQESQAFQAKAQAQYDAQQMRRALQN